MSDCIFCGIVAGSIPSKQVYEDEEMIAFHDLYPAAPVHVLIIPKKHIPSMLAVTEEDYVLMGRMTKVIQSLAQELGIAESGFRVVNNCGEEGGQTVGHLHYHILGGRSLGWPPG
ncbi:histidine triad nucleotide-binding protein [Mechercharimyces sp. CAU 1602]|uniref:histidine triad nucleotide-binding protein n=1 Tax=Mechercharimyces sp. CAU 1602 TaxID=2973933 RepID=UPI0021621DF1|nr:histidine triad nucleotide-binding protein [Mechercharimyces sp. CAU 1602]MCS1350462.1 histidine triad nucleotide-binding protein [Mechercharimyces sp. CAU 1602]